MKLYVEEHGGGHHPLLLLTGLGYAIWSWQRQLPEWSRSFRCIAVESRGTGRSPKPPGPYSIEEMADDAAEALAGRRAHVAGFSMGGYIAQTLVLRHPELVERLVLVSYDACLDRAARVTPVERIEAPTLVVHGDADRIVPFENGVELARRIPDARFEALPGAGHLLFIEDAPRFNPMVASFLTD